MGAARPFRQAVKCGAATIAIGLWKPFLSGLLGVFAVAALAVEASGASYYRPSTRTAIAAALKTPEMKQLGSLFAPLPGSSRCHLHGGGPPPGTTTVMT